MTGGSWQVEVSSWQVEGGMWANCLEALRKAGMSCPHQLVVGGNIPDIAGGLGQQRAPGAAGHYAG